MEQNNAIEQPDLPEKKDNPNEKKDKPELKPEDFGYKKFEPNQHREALLKAKGAPDKEADEATRRLETELAQEGQKILKPEALRGLDESIKLKKEDEKAPKKDVEAKEHQAFSKLMNTLQENNRLPINVDGQSHAFDFKGLTKDSKEMKAQETQKLLEHADQGGEIPPNIEFQFHTSFKKGRDQNETVDVDYRLNLHQIMRDGLEATLSSLLSLSYVAAASYDAKKGDKQESARAEVVKPQNEKAENMELESLKKLLQKNNISTSTIQTAQWSTLEISLPEKQKQISITHDGAVFQLTEKRIDKTVETQMQTPQEVLQYIEKESK